MVNEGEGNGGEGGAKVYKFPNVERKPAEPGVPEESIKISEKEKDQLLQALQDMSNKLRFLPPTRLTPDELTTIKDSVAALGSLLGNVEKRVQNVMRQEERYRPVELGDRIKAKEVSTAFRELFLELEKLSKTEYSSFKDVAAVLDGLNSNVLGWDLEKLNKIKDNISGTRRVYPVTIARNHLARRGIFKIKREDGKAEERVIYLQLATPNDQEHGSQFESDKGVKYFLDATFEPVSEIPDGLTFRVEAEALVRSKEGWVNPHFFNS